MRLRNIPGAKEAVKESPFCIPSQQALSLAGQWGSVFGNDHPIHLEVGMGKGRFLMDMASLHREVNYLGMERYESVLLRALEKREGREEAGEVFDNLFFLCMDARILGDIFIPGEVERIYLNFSDPWPKAKHRSRRLPSREFLSLYEKILSKEGRVEFKTDNQELFRFALSEAKECGWPILYETWDLHGKEEIKEGEREEDGKEEVKEGAKEEVKAGEEDRGEPPFYENVCTEYEAKFVAQGKPICKVVLGYPLR